MFDILLHCAGASLMTLLGAIVGLWFFGAPVPGAWVGAVFSALFWPFREALQARERQGHWDGPWDWSARRLREAFVPAAVGLALAVLATFIL